MVDGICYACSNVECPLFVVSEPYTRCKSCRKFSLKSCPAAGCPYLLVHCSTSNYSTYVIDHLTTHPDNRECQAMLDRLNASRRAILDKKRVPGSKVSEVLEHFREDPEGEFSVDEMFLLVGDVRTKTSNAIGSLVRSKHVVKLSNGKYQLAPDGTFALDPPRPLSPTNPARIKREREEEEARKKRSGNDNDRSNRIRASRPRPSANAPPDRKDFEEDMLQVFAGLKDSVNVDDEDEDEADEVVIPPMYI